MAILVSHQCKYGTYEQKVWEIFVACCCRSVFGNVFNYLKVSDVSLGARHQTSGKETCRPLRESTGLFFKATSYVFCM